MSQFSTAHAGVEFHAIATQRQREQPNLRLISPTLWKTGRKDNTPFAFAVLLTLLLRFLRLFP